MIEINITSDLPKLQSDLDKILTTLNEDVHNAGFILDGMIKRDIAAYPSVDTGRFMSSITTDNGVPFVSRVFTTVPYAAFLEYGTSPHFIAPVTKQALAWKGGGQWFFSKELSAHFSSSVKFP